MDVGRQPRRHRGGPRPHSRTHGHIQATNEPMSHVETFVEHVRLARHCGCTWGRKCCAGIRCPFTFLGDESGDNDSPGRRCAAAPSLSPFGFLRGPDLSGRSIVDRSSPWSFRPSRRSRKRRNGGRSTTASSTPNNSLRRGPSPAVRRRMQCGSWSCFGTAAHRTTSRGGRRVRAWRRGGDVAILLPGCPPSGAVSNGGENFVAAAYVVLCPSGWIVNWGS